MKRLFALLFCMSMYCFLQAQCIYKVIGHRGGDSYNYPENTLLALEHGFMQGIYSAEVDVRITSDSVFVLLHDAYLDRTTNGSGYLIDYTYNEIKNLDAGSWKGQKFAGQKIPKLSEALELCKKYNSKLYLNMKVYEPDLLGRLLDSLNVPLDMVMVDPDAEYLVDLYYQHLPNRAMVYFGEVPSPVNDTSFYLNLKNKGVFAFEIVADEFINNRVNDTFLNMLNYSGIELWAYTANKSSLIQYLKNKGIVGLETDMPSIAKDVFCNSIQSGFFPKKEITAQWNFNQGLNASIGSKLVFIGDTNNVNQKIQFGKCSDFNLDFINNSDVSVAKIPALDPNHALRFYSNIFPEGYPGELHCDNDYSIVMDIYKAKDTLGRTYFSLFQTSNNNADDADLFVHNQGIGILEQYHGLIQDSTWYRLIFSFDLYNNIVNKYINGNFVGSTSLNNSLNGRFCMNNNWAIQSSNFFSDNDNETGLFYVSSIQVRNYAINSSEANALGSVSSNKISNEIMIDSLQCPVISYVSNDTIIDVQSNLILIVEAGNNVNYSWQEKINNNWVDVLALNYMGTKSKNLTIKNISENKEFRCIVNNNCYKISPTIKVEVKALGIEKNNLSNIEIYPNPSENFINIKSIESIVDIEFYNLQGVLLHRHNNVKANMKLQHDLEAGYYIVRVIKDKESIVKRLIVH